METVVHVGVAFAGFILGALVFSRVGHWFVGIQATLKDRDTAPSSRATKLASAVMLASGPWILLAVAVLAFNVYGQPWAPWLLGGTCAALVFFGVLTVRLARKAAASSKQHAT